MQLETFPNATKLDITKDHGISEVYNFNIFPLPGDSAVRKLRGLDNPDEAIVDIDAQNYCLDLDSGHLDSYIKNIYNKKNLVLYFVYVK